MNTNATLLLTTALICTAILSAINITTQSSAKALSVKVDYAPYQGNAVLHELNYARPLLPLTLARR